MENAKTDLYSQLEVYYLNGRENVENPKGSKEAEAIWKANGDVIVPWANVDDLANSYWNVFPVLCDVSSQPFFNPAYQPTEAPTISPYPSHRPSHAPTYIPGEPTPKPSAPSYYPTPGIFIPLSLLLLFYYYYL